jgi:hypothetical protein
MSFNAVGVVARGGIEPTDTRIFSPGPNFETVSVSTGWLGVRCTEMPNDAGPCSTDSRKTPARRPANGRFGRNRTLKQPSRSSFG